MAALVTVQSLSGAPLLRLTELSGSITAGELRQQVCVENPWISGQQLQLLLDSHVLCESELVDFSNEGHAVVTAVVSDPLLDVIVWGDDRRGADFGEAGGQLVSGIVSICASEGAFTALTGNSSLVTWGEEQYKRDSESRCTKAAIAVCSTCRAFAALLEDGSVTAWGDPGYGGDNRAVSEQLASDIVSLVSSKSAFAALKASGEVVCWGDPGFGGDWNSVQGQLIGKHVPTLFSSQDELGAVCSSGEVFVWGNDLMCFEGSGNGDLRRHIIDMQEGVALPSFVSMSCPESPSRSMLHRRLWSTCKDVLCRDGKCNYHADLSSVTLSDTGAVQAWFHFEYCYGAGSLDRVEKDLASGVLSIHRTDLAFAALKEGGEVVVWGHPQMGGDCSACREQLACGVLAICSTDSAFAALREGGCVVTWGDAADGGEMSVETANRVNSGVVALCSTGGAFAALKHLQ